MKLFIPQTELGYPRKVMGDLSTDFCGEVKGDSMSNVGFKKLFVAVFLFGLMPSFVLAQIDSPGQPNQKGFALVELFTSEGCSSCPPADKLLAAIDKTAGEQNLPIYVISMHVDYWNQLGWRDPFSSSQFSQRQRQYAALSKENRVYTPQMIVNGEYRFVGSRSKEAFASISQSLANPTTAKLSIKLDGDQLSYEVEGMPADAVLNVALIQPVATQSVPRGENANRTLEHTNVARWFKTYSIESDRGKFVISKEHLTEEVEELIAYVQSSETGQIVAVASTRL